MPLPMIHLAIAVQLGAQHAPCLSPGFLLGSIAPDAIHMRPNTNRDDKRVTHLIDELGGFPIDADIRALIQEHLTAQSPLPLFALGYAAHILTDSLWRRTLLETFQSRIPADLDQATYRTLYYQETDQIDFNLYHQAGWRAEVWEKLAAAAAVDFPPLLTGDEIDGWRVRTVRWFTEIKSEPGITPQYITDAMAHTFIDSAADHVAEQLGSWGLLVP